MSDGISINLGEQLIRLVKAKNEGGKLNIHFLLQELDAPQFFDFDTQKITDDESKALKKLIDISKISKKSVNIVVPDGQTYSQILWMPKLKEKELLSAIRYQADQFIPMPIEETSLDLEILAESKEENNLLVLIVAAPQKLVQKVERLVEAVGLYPDSVENELSATGKLLTNFYVPPTADGGTVFINFGYSTTSFYYYDHKLRLLADSHTYEVGLSFFLREAQADANVDPLKAKNLLKNIGFSANASVDLNQILKPSTDVMCTELVKFIASVTKKFKIPSVSHIYLFNLATEILQLDAKVQSTVSIPSSIFDATQMIKRTPVLEPHIKDLSSFIAPMGGCLQ